MLTLQISNSKMVASNVCCFKMSEPELTKTSGVYLGKTATYKIPILLDLDDLLNPHIAIVGMTGSGKTYLMKSLIARSRLQKHYNLVIIDWNSEYTEITKFLGGTVLDLGSTADLNLFDAFIGAGSNAEPVIEILTSLLKLSGGETALLHSTIRSAISTKQDTRTFNISRVIDLLQTTADPLKQNLITKLLMLKGNPIFRERTSFRPVMLMESVYSFNLQHLNNDLHRRLASSAIMRLLIEAMHNTHIGRQTDTMIVLDEAWRLSKGPELGMLFREARKYGISIAASTQLGNDMPLDAIANAAAVVIFRIQNDEDFEKLVNIGVIEAKHRAVLSELPMGSCMLHLAYKHSRETNTFVIDKVQGLPTSFYTISGGKMQLIVNISKFVKQTEQLSTNAEIRSAILRHAEEHNRSVELDGFIAFMIKLGLKRREIVPYLKLLGMDDLSLIAAYSIAEQQLVEVKHNE